MRFLDQIADACRRESRRAKWVIVPTHALGHTLGDRLALQAGAWGNLRFRTLADLALETAGPALAAAGVAPMAPELGPPLVLRLLVDLPAETPAHFRPLATEPRMAGALWRSLGDLRLAGVTAASFDRSALDHSGKAAELHALLEAYEAWLAASRVADFADLLRVAGSSAGSGPVAAHDVLLVWPDRVWSPLERALLAALPAERLAARLPRADGVSRPRRLPGAPVEYVASDPPGCVAAWSPLGRIGSGGPEATDRPPRATIDVFRAGSRDAEVEEVCRRIAALGVPLDEVEIVSASPGYHTLVWERALALGWPATVAQGVPVAMTGPGRALLAWTRWLDEGVAASGLRQMLGLGALRYAGPDASGPASAARLLSRADATWGRSTYRPALARLRAAELARAADADLDETRRARAAATAARVEHLEGWIARLLGLVPEPDADGTVGVAALARGATTLVDEFVVVPDEARAARDEQARVDRLAHLALREELAGLSVLGDWRASLSDALAFVREAIDRLSVGSDRARPGRLHITSLPSAGLAGRPVTYLVGVEEGRLFPALIEDPVLLDVERTRLSPDLQTSHDRASEAVHLAVSRLAALEGRLTFSYSCRDQREARPSFPSWVLLQAARLQARDASLSYEGLARRLGAPVTSVPASGDLGLDDAGWWLATLRHGALDEVTATAVVDGAFGGLAAGRAAARARAAETFSEFDGWVPDAGPALDPRQSGRPLSPTRLEGFAACPYRYFLEQGLGLAEYEVEERTLDRWLDPRTRGAVLHALYAGTLRRLRDSGRHPDPGRDRVWVHELADAELARLREAMPPPSEQVFARERHELLVDLDVFLEGEAAEPARVPVALEVGFGLVEDDPREVLGSSAPVEIPLTSGRSVRLRGRIDRIDRLPGGGYEVVDYKTGLFVRREWSGTLRGGRMLQHALYGLAAVALLAGNEPRPRVVQGTYYFSTRRGRRRRVVVPTPPVSRVVGLLDRLFDVAAAGAFLHTPEEDDCRFCSFAAACLKNHQSAARKLAVTPALARFAEVRSHE
jgi:hypothetical protein